MRRRMLSLESRAERLGNGWGCCVSICLWPAIDNMRTGWLLGLHMVSLRLVIGFFTGHCEIRVLTGFGMVPSRTIAGYVVMRKS